MVDGPRVEPSERGKVGVFPGTFNPLTVAHLRIARVAVEQHGLDRLDLAVSRRPLLKEHVDRPRWQDRLRVLEAAAAGRSWLGVVVTDATLLADIAGGYDLLVMGADKWAEVNEPRFYGGDPEARDRAVASLPVVAIVPRPPHPVPEAVRLDVEDELLVVSSTAARGGATAWMAEEARAFDVVSGAWSDPDRYERWLAGEASEDP